MKISSSIHNQMSSFIDSRASVWVELRQKKDRIVMDKRVSVLQSLQFNGDPDGMLGDGTEQCRVE